MTIVIAIHLKRKGLWFRKLGSIKIFEEKRENCIRLRNTLNIETPNMNIPFSTNFAVNVKPKKAMSKQQKSFVFCSILQNFDENVTKKYANFGANVT